MAERLLRGAVAGALLMFEVFAVDPSAIADEANFGRIVDQCGPRTGRFIARCPRKWQDLVLEAAPWKPVQRLRIVDRLRRATALAVCDVARDFSAGDWLVETEREAELFKAIVALDNPRAHPKVVNRDDLDPDAEPWRVARECRVAQTGRALAGLLSPLLRCSRELQLVDPYFGPETPRFRKVFEALLTEAARDGRGLRRCEVHLTARADERFFRSSCDSQLARLIPRGIKVELFRWNELPDGDQFHARYIVTDLGGVRVDGGLDEKPPGQQTDVSLLDPDIWHRVRSDFDAGTATFKLVDRHAVPGRAAKCS
ncbi:MAG: hypothetical protein IT348_11015 [Candidatus Eisenbacteria bacterium]|nr:hypothetical protein [Candidatus Eisenbacteria bacterium]